MSKSNRNTHLSVCVSGILACLSGTAGATTIFTENFNGYAGNQNTTQADTGLNVAHTGGVAGWSTSGAGTMHAVDLGASDWAIMFFQDNVIRQSSGIGANDLGTNYEVTFDYGTAVYAVGNYAQRTQAGDGLLIEVLRGDNSVLASQTFNPGAWSESDSSNRNLSAGLTGTLAYAGDGTGVVRLRIGPDGALNSGRFEGEIDNISVDIVPEPTTTALLGLGGLALIFRRRK